MIVNDAIKFMIPELKDVQLSRVGEVYYEGIEHAKSRDCLPLYEKECIQGLIVCALHCHRTGVNKAAQSVAKVYFYDELLRHNLWFFPHVVNSFYIINF